MFHIIFQMLSKELQEEITTNNEDETLVNSKNTMGACTTVLGLLSGMIGGPCLVLPIMGIKSGWITSTFVCAIVAWLSYYTAKLIIIHLGKGKEVTDSILSHFGNDYRYMVGYAFLIWLSFMPFMPIFFRIMCLQIDGLIGYHSPYVGPLVTISLIAFIIYVRIYDVGQQTLALGILAIIGFVLLLCWAQFAAPSGQKAVPAFGQIINISATMLMAQAVHNFLIANIIKNPNRSQYDGINKWTYLIGGSIHVFVALTSFAIVNRVPFKAHPETINDYFHPGQWQNSVIEVTYLINMLSTYPNFLIIAKTRFFQMFKIELQDKITPKEIIFICSVVIVSYLFYVLGVELNVMMTLSGAIVGFIYIFFIPIWMHFKCIFYDRSSGYIENDPQWNQQIVPNRCQCQNVYRNKFTLYLQTIFLLLVLILGVSLIIVTIGNVANNKA